MRAVLQERYGGPDIVRLGELPDPRPAADQVLIRVKAASLNGSDRENLLGRPFYSRVAGLRRPRNPVPGSDVAGVVEEVGAAVTDLVPGQEVFGELAGYRGGLAELVAAQPGLLAAKPPELSFAEAAAIPQAGTIAWSATRGVRPGDHVLVNGAGGAGGTFVVGIAKHLGATVTAVDRADKRAHLERIGADRPIAFEEEDWAHHRARYDRIIDLVGHRSPFRVHRALRPGGRYLVVGGYTRVLLATLLAGPLIRAVTGRNVGVLVVPQSRAGVEAAAALVTSGAVGQVIDQVYPLDDAPTALMRLASGDNAGKIVVEI